MVYLYNKEHWQSHPDVALVSGLLSLTLWHVLSYFINTHECGNWDEATQFPQKGIHKWVFSLQWEKGISHYTVAVSCMEPIHTTAKKWSSLLYGGRLYCTVFLFHSLSGSPGRTPRGGPRTRRRWPWRCPAGRSRPTWWWAHGWTSCSCCCSAQSQTRWSLQNVNTVTISVSDSDRDFATRKA